MALTYTQLTDAIQQYTENTETTFVANLPLFVRQAEQRIYNMVQAPVQRKNQLGTMTSGNRYLTAPTDFLSPYSMAVISGGQVYYLLNKDVGWLREAYPTNDTARPEYYGIFDDTTFILAPMPDQNYSTELHYYALPTSLATLGGSNTTWLSTNFESALLYACLVEAYTYMKGEPDLIQQYDKRYQEALANFKILADGKDQMDTYRIPQTRVPVP